MDNAEKEPTVREALNDAIALHTETPAEAPVVESSPAPEAEPKPGRTAGRARDERGKLLPGAAKRDAAPESPKPADPPPANVAQPATPAAAPEAPPIPRPSSWKKEMWPLWDKLTTGAPLTAQEARQVAEYNAQRESQFASGVSTYKGIAESAKPLMDAIAPFQQDLDRHGIAAPDMVHRLMSAHKSLAMGSPHEKLQLLGKLANDYGIPIQALYDQSAQQAFLATPYQAQPQQVPQPQNIAEMIERTLADREVKQTISTMAKDTTKYPFFNYVRPTMVQLLDSGEAADLEDAYQKALDAPEHAMLTTVQQAQQAQAAEQQRLATAQATVRAAKANTVSVRSATPASGGAPKGNPSVREALTAAVEQHRTGARV